MPIPIHGKDCGPKDLLDISFAYGGIGAVQVTRWCRRCGAVVVDVDYDERTNPGGLMPMMFPTYE